METTKVQVNTTHTTHTTVLREDEGWIKLWTSRGWGHIVSAENRLTRYFLHHSDWLGERQPKLGERVKFIVTEPFWYKGTANRLLRAAQVRPWASFAEEQAANEEALFAGAFANDSANDEFDAAKLLSGKGGAL